MTLQEALKSGRRIRNVEIGFDFNNWTEGNKYSFSPKEVLSEYWEVEPKTHRSVWVTFDDSNPMVVYGAGTIEFIDYRGAKAIEFVELPEGAKVLTEDMINHAWSNDYETLLENLGFE